MKTIIFNLGLMTLLLIAVGCEDEMIYPAPQKYPDTNDPDMYIKVDFLLNSEFISAFSKNTYQYEDAILEGSAWDMFYWMGLMPDQLVYVMQLDGEGENVMLGKFGFRLSSAWASSSQCITYARITSETGGALNINIMDNGPELTPDYPYDQMSYEKPFVVSRGEGLFEGCEGKGTLALSVSDSSLYLMKVRLDGTITLVIARH